MRRILAGILVVKLVAVQASSAAAGQAGSTAQVGARSSTVKA